MFLIKFNVSITLIRKDSVVPKKMMNKQNTNLSKLKMHK